MRKKRTSSLARNWVKDTAIGALAFLLLPLLATAFAPGTGHVSFSEAFAGEVIASRAVEVTSPPGATAENAIVAVAQFSPAAKSLEVRRHHERIILVLTFSLLMGLNLAFWRHLRRVSATSRRNLPHRRA